MWQHLAGLADSSAAQYKMFCKFGQKFKRQQRILGNEIVPIIHEQQVTAFVKAVNWAKFWAFGHKSSNSLVTLMGSRIIEAAMYLESTRPHRKLKIGRRLGEIFFSVNVNKSSLVATDSHLKLFSLFIIFSFELEHPWKFADCENSSFLISRKYAWPEIKHSHFSCDLLH